MKKIKLLIIPIVCLIFILYFRTASAATLSKVNYLDPDKVSCRFTQELEKGDTFACGEFLLPAGHYLLKWDAAFEFEYISIDFYDESINDTKVIEISHLGTFITSDLGESGQLEYLSYTNTSTTAPKYDNSTLAFDFTITKDIKFSFNFDSLNMKNAYGSDDYYNKDSVLTGTSKTVSLLRIDYDAVDGSFNPYQKVQYDPDYIAEDVEEASKKIEDFSLTYFYYDKENNKGVVEFQFDNREYTSYSYTLSSLQFYLINAEDNSKFIKPTMDLILDDKSLPEAGYYVYTFDWDMSLFNYKFNEIQLLNITVKNNDLNYSEVIKIVGSNDNIIKSLSDNGDNFCWANYGTIYSFAKEKLVKSIEVKELMNNPSGFINFNKFIFDDHPSLALNLVDEDGNRIDNLLNITFGVNYYYNWWNKNVLSKEEYKVVSLSSGHTLTTANLDFICERVEPIDWFYDFTSLYDVDVWNSKIGFTNQYNSDEYNYVVSFDNMYELTAVQYLSCLYVVEEETVMIGSFMEDKSFWLWNENTEELDTFQVDSVGNIYLREDIDFNEETGECIDPISGENIAPGFIIPEEDEGNGLLDWLNNLVNKFKNNKVFKVLSIVFGLIAVLFIFILVKWFINLFRKKN